MPLYNPVPANAPTFVAGRWYPLNRDLMVGTGSAMNANFVHLLPFMLTHPVTVSDLGTLIHTASAGGNIRLGIYGADPATNYPTGAALAQTGNIVTDATGAVSADITGANVVLPPGLYWQAANSDNAVVVLRAPLVGQVLTTGALGFTSLADATGASSTDTRQTMLFASAFGAFPDLTGQTINPAGAYYAVLFAKAA